MGIRDEGGRQGAVALLVLTECPRQSASGCLRRPLGGLPFSRQVRSFQKLRHDADTSQASTLTTTAVLGRRENDRKAIAAHNGPIEQEIENAQNDTASQLSARAMKERKDSRRAIAEEDRQQPEHFHCVRQRWEQTSSGKDLATNNLPISSPAPRWGGSSTATPTVKSGSYSGPNPKLGATGWCWSSRSQFSNFAVSSGLWFVGHQGVGFSRIVVKYGVPGPAQLPSAPLAGFSIFQGTTSASSAARRELQHRPFAPHSSRVVLLTAMGSPLEVLLR